MDCIREDEQLVAAGASIAIHVLQFGLLARFVRYTPCASSQVVAGSASLSIKALYNSMDCIG